jgi:hypothetical protein
MVLSPQQLAILKSPVTRAYLQANKGDFAYVDVLLKESGPDCPRLPKVWEKIFPANDIERQRWLSSTFKTGPVQIVPQAKPVKNMVNRAINVLQSFKQTP